MSRSAWLTLGDLRLPALRIAAATAPLLGLLLLGGSPSKVLAGLAFVAWAVGPPSLVEQLARRRGLGSVVLRVGVVGGLSVPVALVQAWWVDDMIAAGPTGALLGLGSLRPEPLVIVGLAAGMAFAGATFVRSALEVRTGVEPVEDFALGHGALALVGLTLGLPVLVCCAVAGALGQLVPEAATAAPTDRE